MYKSILISSETTVSDTLSMLWSCYPQLNSQYLCLFEYCPDQDYERILNGDQCPLEVMRTWEEGMEYKFVLKLVKSPVVPLTAIDEKISPKETQNKILPDSLRKSDDLKTEKFSINCENQSSKLFSMTVDISINGDTIGDTASDTESDESELNISDEEEYHLKD